MSALTEKFISIGRDLSDYRRMPRYFSDAGDGGMMIRWTQVGLAIAIAAFALLFVYCVIFAFRTGYVVAPF